MTDMREQNVMRCPICGQATYTYRVRLHRFAKFDYDVCDGWERNSNTYRVVVRGPDLPETEKTYVVEREFEPTFYAYAE